MLNKDIVYTARHIHSHKEVKMFSEDNLFQLQSYNFPLHSFYIILHYKISFKTM